MSKSNVVNITDCALYRSKLRKADAIALQVIRGRIKARVIEVKEGTLLYFDDRFTVHGINNNITYGFFTSEEEAQYWILNHLYPKDNPEILLAQENKG